jgi:hypothetical protein
MSMGAAPASGECWCCFVGAGNSVLLLCEVVSISMIDWCAKLGLLLPQAMICLLGTQWLSRVPLSQAPCLFLLPASGEQQIAAMP